MDGTIVLNAIGPLPVGSDPVGTVVYHSSSGATVTRDLPDLHIAEATKPNTGDPFDREARPCKFGLNMYAKERSKTTPNKPPVRMRRGAEVAAVPYLPSRGDVPSSKLAEEPEEESKVCIFPLACRRISSVCVHTTSPGTHALFSRCDGLTG